MLSLRASPLTKAGPSESGARIVATALQELGWERQVDIWPAQAAHERVVELRAAGQSQVLLLLRNDLATTRAASLSYSREAAYVVTWSEGAVQLGRSTVWREEPGDTAYAQAPAADEEALRDLVATLNRDDVLDRALDQLAPRATNRPALADKLAAELAALRMHIAESRAYAGASPDAADRAVLGLFHRLLYVRVAEDRGALHLRNTLESISHSDDPVAELADLLAICSRRLNSELFMDPGAGLEEISPRALTRLLTAMTEPWARLKLDFSVAETELPSRLYETYLGLIPIEEDPARTQRLFTTVAPADRRSSQASYFTPVALAEVLVHRVLTAWTAANAPRHFCDVRVVDPACGSGTFLCAAYKWLRLYFERQLRRPLSAAERAELLTSSIFGADIDERALGLARVQLLELAEIEGTLPPLADNLFRGDALMCPPGEPPSGGAVHWDAFVARVGRPTCIITNPPFISEGQRRHKLGPDAVHRLDRLYPGVRSKGADHAYTFVALAAQLLESSGGAGFILPRQALDGESGTGTRQLLLREGLHWITDLRTTRVFPDVDVGVCAVATLRSDAHGTVVMQSPKDHRAEARRILDALGVDAEQPELIKVDAKSDDLENRTTAGWSPLRVRQSRERHEGLSAESKLRDHASVTQGVKPAGPVRIDPARVTSAGSGRLRIDGIATPDTYAPVLVRGRDISPFLLRTTGLRVLLPFETDRTLTANPSVRALIENAGGVPKNYRFGDLAVLRAPKVLVRTLSYEPAAVSAGANVVPLVRGAHAVCFPEIDARQLPGVAAIFNSALFQWLLRNSGTPRQNDFVELVDRDLEELPWVRLPEEILEELTKQTNIVTAALQLKDPLARAAASRSARRLIDEVTFELFEASARLRATVRSELLREA